MRFTRPGNVILLGEVPGVVTGHDQAPSGVRRILSLGISRERIPVFPEEKLQNAVRSQDAICEV